MSMDFSKGTYRPTRTDNKFRTSYALMSQWMNRKGASSAYKKDPLPTTFVIAMQGNAAFTKTTPRFRYPEGGDGDPGIAPGDSPRQELPPPAQRMPAMQAAIDENIPVHLRFSEGHGHDDFNKAYQQTGKQWPSASFSEFGPPRLRHGRAGGSWRHVKEVLQAGGARIVFVDGLIRLEEGIKLDELPGGHLIQPNVDKNSIKSRHLMSGQRQGGEHLLEKKKGVEKNNWMVMR